MAQGSNVDSLCHSGEGCPSFVIAKLGTCQAVDDEEYKDVDTTSFRLLSGGEPTENGHECTAALIQDMGILVSWFARSNSRQKEEGGKGMGLWCTSPHWSERNDVGQGRPKVRRLIREKGRRRDHGDGN
jgi:hypothetical protein